MHIGAFIANEALAIAQFGRMSNARVFVLCGLVLMIFVRCAIPLWDLRESVHKPQEKDSRWNAPVIVIMTTAIWLMPLALIRIMAWVGR